MKALQGGLQALGRIRVRLLFVNLVVVLVPLAGLEFADLYEQQLLGGLERDMRDQAVLARRFLEAGLQRGTPLDAPGQEDALRRAAARTRTRVRVFNTDREIVLDSHRTGAPEGPEPLPPSWLSSSSSVRYDASADVEAHAPWPVPAERIEVRQAFAAQPSSYTRVRARQPAVLLFVAEPIIVDRRIEGVVYAVRSTAPVLIELYRIRQGLYLLTGLALVFTLLVTLLLAWSISRPLSRLARAAGRIAAGERDVEVPVGGAGEIRELGEAFAAMTAQLEKRLRFASDFAADVAHEFKSPLTSIRGAAELLSEGASDDAAARERFLSNIQLDVERLDRLVSRLLELGRIEAGQSARQLIVVPQLVESLRRRYPGVTMDVRSKGTLARGRAADVDRAVGNLIENAMRYASSAEAVSLTVQDDVRHTLFIVDDDGPGVPEGDRKRIFERFFTTDQNRQGTGLGLAIVRVVAESHGGDVDVTASPQGGARFVLSLPRKTS
ncbi:MAG: ATP-binding protein [Myxococcota bacterium]